MITLSRSLREGASLTGHFVRASLLRCLSDRQRLTSKGSSRHSQRGMPYENGYIYQLQVEMEERVYASSTALTQGRIDHQAQGGLTFGRNPVTCAGHQIQKAPGGIPKNILNGSLFRRVEANPRDMKTQCFTMGIHNQYSVTDVEVAQVPKHCWVPSRPIQVPRYHCTPLIAWTRTIIVQANIVPGTLPGCFHRPIRSNLYRLDGSVDTDGGNEQTREWWGSRTGRGSNERETTNTKSQGYQRGEYTQY